MATEVSTALWVDYALQYGGARRRAPGGGSWFGWLEAWVKGAWARPGWHGPRREGRGGLTQAPRGPTPLELDIHTIRTCRVRYTL